MRINMNIYYAPMEGITLYPLRNIHREIFGDSIDKYFTPFLTASHTFHFKNREKKDVLPDKNPAFDDYPNQVQPQIMAGNAENFLWAAKEMKKLGYNEVNLNLGCPAPTVVTRHKGAGLLTDPDYLDDMLKQIFSASSEKELFPEISLKTRLGFSDPAEADRLMEIYAKYPVKELIIHARVREDFYSGSARLEDFKRAVGVYRENGGKADICYNGNIDSAAEYTSILEKLQSGSSDGNSTGINSVMIGRGLLSEPSLARQIRAASDTLSSSSASTDGPADGASLTPEELRTYLKRLYEAYAEYIPEDRNVIFKLLEHWAFLHVHFRDCDRQLKAIRKSRSKAEYHAAVNNIFANCEFISIAGDH